MTNERLPDVLTAISVARLSSAQKVLMYVIASYPRFTTYVARDQLVQRTGLSDTRFGTVVDSLIEKELVYHLPTTSGNILRLGLEVKTVLALQASDTGRAAR